MNRIWIDEIRKNPQGGNPWGLRSVKVEILHYFEIDFLGRVGRDKEGVLAHFQLVGFAFQFRSGPILVGADHCAIGHFLGDRSHADSLLEVGIDIVDDKGSLRGGIHSIVLMLIER